LSDVAPVHVTSHALLAHFGAPVPTDGPPHALLHPPQCAASLVKS
jgi:hypothetical protein